jgi:uncharacterized protein
MSAALPETMDPWRMVAARRSFQGVLPLARMQRLGELLADAQGEAEYTLDFGRDELGTAYMDVHVRAPLTLTCQRTLKPFDLPVALDTRLGLIDDDSDEDALPPGCEPLVVIDDRIHPAAVIEDELLLAVPLVPVAPDSEWPAEGMQSTAPDAPDATTEDNPFAVLRELKRK